MPSRGALGSYYNAWQRLDTLRKRKRLSQQNPLTVEEQEELKKEIQNAKKTFHRAYGPLFAGRGASASVSDLAHMKALVLLKQINYYTCPNITIDQPDENIRAKMILIAFEAGLRVSQVRQAKNLLGNENPKVPIDDAAWEAMVDWARARAPNARDQQ